MSRSKWLALTPVLPEKTAIERLAQSFASLDALCDITWIDALAFDNPHQSSAQFYQAWQVFLSEQEASYTGFMGLSLGGVILQQCLPTLTTPKPILLFSTPSYIDDILACILKKVIRLARNDQTTTALNYLYQHVYCNYQPQDLAEQVAPTSRVRLISGLNKVLAGDTRAFCTANIHPGLHFIGACSKLVKHRHALPAPNIKLITVPDAGMRVFEDNPAFCLANITLFITSLVRSYLEVI